MKAAILAIFLIGSVCSVPIDTSKETMMDKKQMVDETTTMEMTTTMMMEETPTTMMTTTKKKSSESKSDEKDETTTMMPTTTKMMMDTMTGMKTGMKTTGTEKKEGKTIEKETPMPINDMMVVGVATNPDAPVIALQLDAATQPEDPLIVSTVTKMTDDMQRDMVSWAREGFRLYKDNEYLVAKHIVTEADAKLGPYWHCAAGESFEAYFTFEKDTFIRLAKGKVHVQCYKHFCSENK